MKTTYRIAIFRYAATIASLAFGSCASVKESSGSASVRKSVEALFRYDEVAIGKVRPLDKVEVARLGKLFVPAVREKIEAFSRAESAIPRARHPENNSVARNEADLMLTGDPLTTRVH
jgi:hypothetical protein